VTGSPLAGLQAAVAAAAQVVGAVGAEQWTLGTPCTEWTVADVTDHLIQSNHAFAAAVWGGAEAATDVPAADSPAGEAPATDRAGRFDASTAELLDAFAAPGALEKVVSVGFGTVPGAVALQLRVTELLVHGWDVAQATGQRLAAPPDVAEQVLAFTHTALRQVPPDRSPFGPPQHAPAGASALEQLVALLGRRVIR
jgi:uncharacterized protein (TIGR03086 family)